MHDNFIFLFFGNLPKKKNIYKYHSWLQAFFISSLMYIEEGSLVSPTAIKISPISERRIFSLCLN
jgi:hypothetical protein